MTITRHYIVFILLILAVTRLLLLLLIYSGLPPVFPSHPLLFKAYLAALSIITFILMPFILQKKLLAFKASMLVSMNYIGLYMLDLSHLLPNPLSSHSPFLFWSEIIGLFLAIPLFMLSIDLSHSNTSKKDKE